MGLIYRTARLTLERKEEKSAAIRVLHLHSGNNEIIQVIQLFFYVNSLQTSGSQSEGSGTPRGPLLGAPRTSMLQVKEYSVKND